MREITMGKEKLIQKSSNK